VRLYRGCTAYQGGLPCYDTCTVLKLRFGGVGKDREYQNGDPAPGLHAHSDVKSVEPLEQAAEGAGVQWKAKPRRVV